MAVRPIDGNTLELWCEKIIDQACHPVTAQIGEVFLDKVRSAPTLTQPNEPLTLEELREMNGEPVWVKRLKGLSVCDTDWAVVVFRLEPDVKHYEIRVFWPGSEYEDEPSEDDYGKTWLAYRRPPEGEEET